MRVPCLGASVAAALLAAGCATPQYQTSVRLIPPEDAAGRACVQTCETRKTACQADCQTRYQACAKALEPQVEARYAQALEQYGRELRLYAAALRDYEMQLHFEWMHSYPFYRSYGWGPWWPGWGFPPPYREPEMPTRERVRTHLEKTQCEADCGCLSAHDTCFVGCGGQRVSETVCVRNCPEGKGAARRERGSDR